MYCCTQKRETKSDFDIIEKQWFSAVLILEYSVSEYCLKNKMKHTDSRLVPNRPQLLTDGQ